MKKQEAEAEKIKHSNLQDKVLTHKKYNAKMQVVEIGVNEISPNSDSYYVYCKLKGCLGENVIETLDYVLKNYSVAVNSH